MQIYFFKKINKLLCFNLKIKAGRNIHGKICVRGQGAGNKKLYRYIDIYRRINNFGRIINIYYDPNRSAKIGLIIYLNGLVSFLILQENIRLNSILYSGTKLCEEKIINGFSLPLKYMPLFSPLSNIELKPFKGSSICRSSGVSCILIGKDKNKGILKLNSGWQLTVSLDCISSLGVISQRLFSNLIIKKAGKNRALGKKPKVRGLAKNPCDHPHGGGNGKKHKPKIPTNAWHTVFKWKHTKNKIVDNYKRRVFKNLT